jgi:hypothetical protein
MKIPKTVKIGAHTFKVIYVKDLYNDGEIDTQKGTIKIRAGMPASQVGTTMIHEALHGMNATLGDKEVGHALLESLSQQIYSFLADNKMLK